MALGLNSLGSQAGEDNSAHVAIAFLALAALAIVTGYLNIKVGK